MEAEIKIYWQICQYFAGAKNKRKAAHLGSITKTTDKTASIALAHEVSAGTVRGGTVFMSSPGVEFFFDIHAAVQNTDHIDLSC